MNDKNSGKDPITWFFNACLLLLFSIVALTAAINLLLKIWMWLFGFAALVGLVVIGIAVWKARRRPW